MKKVIMKLISPPWQVAVSRYLLRPRNYTFDGLTICVQPGVFHPGFFFSTRFLLGFLRSQSLVGKTFLELGSGSGLIAAFAARQGARVTAADISEMAVKNTQDSATRNQLTVEVVKSDLFTNIPPQIFDWIVINPPYYPANPKSEAAHAWYCGDEHQYFKKLFCSIESYFRNESRVVMVLSDVCDLETIFSIARTHRFYFVQLADKAVWADGRNYIFRVCRL